MKSLLKGFTMIELLIVISVLGILAVGLLAAVDPFEQLKKARDTNTRQSVLSLQTGFVRYYSTHNAFPWDNSASGGCYTAFGGANPVVRPAGVAIDSTNMKGCIENGPEAEGELKAGFITALGASASTIFVNSTGPTAVSVCFPPQSKSVRSEDGVKYSSLGVDTSVGGTVNDACSSLWKAANTDNFTACHYCAM